METMDDVINYLGDIIFPVSVESLVKEFGEGPIIEAMENGYIDKVTAVINGVKRSNKLMTLSEKGFEYYNKINDNG